MDSSREKAVACAVYTSGAHANGKQRTPSKITCDDKEKAKTEEMNACSASKKFSQFLKININKPLIPLKIAIFCWFAAGSAVLPFISLYLKQLGLTLGELSVIYMIIPFVQFFGSTMSGVVADKFGRSKPILQANLLITAVAITGMLFIPGLKENSCYGTRINCHAQRSADNDTFTENCDIRGNGSHLISCIIHCHAAPSSKGNDLCFESYISECLHLHEEDLLHNLTFSDYTMQNDTKVTCNEKNVEYTRNTSHTWCLSHFVNDCNSTCKRNQSSQTVHENNCQDNDGRTQLFTLSLILVVAYSTFLSNSYRIFDVTAMSMVKTYDSDFGRQRIWAIMGSMISSPLSGCIISAISPQGGPQRYDVAFYMFDAMVVVTAFTVWKLDIKIEPPAKNMLKNTALLLKNVDTLMFLLTILVIGTTWGFTKLFYTWYLEDLGAPSILMGLTVSLGSLVGLPFLFASNWFVEKIGSSNLLVLCLLGYVAWCTGYSFLINPWWALIYEIFGILTYHLLWVTVVRHSHAVAPPGLTATVIATAGGVHYGIGKGSGSLIGGNIMGKYGGRTAYRVMAVICAATAAIYMTYLYSSRKHKTKEADRKYTER